MIALALEEEFIQAMFLVSGPFRSCTDALSALDSELPDVAVLDSILEDGPCHDLALANSERMTKDEARRIAIMCSGPNSTRDEARRIARLPELMSAIGRRYAAMTGVASAL